MSRDFRDVGVGQNSDFGWSNTSVLQSKQERFDSGPAGNTRSLMYSRKPNQIMKNPVFHNPQDRRVQPPRITFRRNSASNFLGKLCCIQGYNRVRASRGGKTEFGYEVPALTILGRAIHLQQSDIRADHSSRPDGHPPEANQVRPALPPPQFPPEIPESPEPRPKPAPARAIRAPQSSPPIQLT